MERSMSMGSHRGLRVPSFAVMEVVHRVERFSKDGRKVLPLHVGQPDACAPREAVLAAERALASCKEGRNRVAYTVESGMPTLRRRITRHYQEEYDVDVPWESVVITTGSSGGFLLAFLAAFDAGDRVAVCVPGYPCYRNVLDSLGVEVVDVVVDASTNYQPTVEMLEELHRKHSLHGLVLTSPSNPCGTVIEASELRKVQQWCESRRIWLVSDEIYHSITYGGIKCATACGLGDNVIVINSFSKYYCMTGWRLGWMVLPPTLLQQVKRLAQSLYISAPTLSQHAALAAFDCKEELDGHVRRYAINREILLEHLPKVGFCDLSSADGAFYIYADVSQLSPDSIELAGRILEETEIAVTPGVDFDPSRGKHFMRFSFASSTDNIKEACRRLLTVEGWRH